MKPKKNSSRTQSTSRPKKVPHEGESTPSLESTGPPRARRQSESDVPPQRWRHLEILEKVGQGSYGEVYRAWDPVLEREVALKLIRPRESQKLKSDTSLISEGRLLARIRHPNVAIVYGVDSSEGQVGLWMEFIHGRTLHALLQENGPFGPQEAALIGLDVCRAVAAVHHNGLIHRDIKAQNIMREEGGRVVLMDFGLGRDLQIEDGSFEKGTGTPSYMAPELLLRNERATPRSDIYALGVLLYYLVTGTYPVSAKSLMELREAHARKEMKLLRDLRPHLPQAFLLVVERALAPESQRFVSVGHLEQALANSLGVESREPLAENAALERGRIGSLFGNFINRKSGWILIGTLSVVMAALFWSYYPRRSFSFNEKDLILLGSFRNLTGESRLDGTLDLAFRMALEQSRYAYIVPEAQVTKTLQQMKRDPNEKIDRALGIGLCQREAINALVIGNILKIGNTYSLSAEVVDPQTGRNVLTRTAVAGSQDKILNALEEVAGEIREQLGESLSALRETTKALEDVTTPNLEALRVYSRGIEQFSHGQNEEAVHLLERAIELDPEFAMAHAKLGIVYYSNAGVITEKALHHWQEALKHKDRLTDYETLYVEGSNAWSGKTEEMIKIWSRMSSLYPNIAAGHHNLGSVYLKYEHRFQEAAEAFAKAARVKDPRVFTSYDHLGYSQLGLGQFEAAIKSFITAWEMERNPLASGLADAYIAVKRYQDALDHLQKTLVASDRIQQLEARSRLASVYVDQGKFRDAIRIYREARDLAQSFGMMRWISYNLSGISACLEQNGSAKDLRMALNNAIEAESLILEDETERLASTSAPRLGVLGKIWARNFGWDRAEESLAKIKRLPDSQRIPGWKASSKILQGEIALVQKRSADAIKHFKSALSDLDLLPAHECLARAYEAGGNIDASIKEYEEITGKRGRAFAENLNQLVGRELNLIGWATAHFHLGRLYEKKGDKEKAISCYQEFLKHWENADQDLPALRETKLRLGNLRAASPKVGKAA